MLANRLKNVIASVVGDTQAYSIPGRSITDSILTVKDTVRTLADGKGLWLGIDLQKAFDCVAHAFLYQTLATLGFGEDFVGWVKLLYGSAKSRVKCNGELTESFSIKRYIRQGCPLSSLLYSLVAEPLAAMLVNDKTIQGVTLSVATEVKIVQYADDINVFVNSVADMDHFLSILRLYELASGAKVNVDKSKISAFGVDKVDIGKWGFKIVNTPRKVLRVFIGKDEVAADTPTWSSVIKKVQLVLNMWRMRGLLLKGKVIVLNALSYSVLNLFLETYALPQWALGSLNKISNEFLWRSKMISVAHCTLIDVVKKGGLNLMDIETKRDAFRIKTVGRFIDVNCVAKWKVYFNQVLSTFGLKSEANFFQHLMLRDLNHLPGFYREVMMAWSKFLPHLVPVVQNREQLMRVPFLNNPVFSFGGRVIQKHTERYYGCGLYVY